MAAVTVRAADTEKLMLAASRQVNVSVSVPTAVGDTVWVPLRLRDYAHDVSNRMILTPADTDADRLSKENVKRR
jgi:hypothetical protein